LTLDQLKEQKKTLEKEYEDKVLELGKIHASKAILEAHILNINFKYTQIILQENELTKDDKKVIVP
jgi:hypothetical protein